MDVITYRISVSLESNRTYSTLQVFATNKIESRPTHEGCTHVCMYVHV